MTLVMTDKEKFRKFSPFKAALILITSSIAIVACAPTPPEKPAVKVGETYYCAVKERGTFFLWDNDREEWDLWQVIDEDTIKNIYTGKTVDGQIDGGFTVWHIDDDTEISGINSRPEGTLIVTFSSKDPIKLLE